MNGVKKLTLIAAATGVLLAQGASTFAADGQVNFNGSITDTTCTITNLTGGQMTVALGNVAKGAFKNVGDRSVPKRFVLQMTGCPSQGAKVIFSGPFVPNKDLIQVASGGAQGVGVAIMTEDQSKSLISPAADANGQVQNPQYDVTPDASGNASLAAVAMYERVGDVTSGTANAVAYIHVSPN